MIDFDTAFALIADAAKPLGSEWVSLAEAHRRRLAAPVVAMVDAPPADVSSMDGYAVRVADLPRARRVGASWPGQAFGRAIGPGECVRIFTGAAIPDGADRVVIQEIVHVEGDDVHVAGDPGDNRFIRARGSDFRVGDTLLAAGKALDARALVAAAGGDVAMAEVHRRPRVATIGTGDELVEPGEARARPGRIPDSISPGLAAMIADYGGRCVLRLRVGDDVDALAAAAGRALEAADLLVMTGGASVGEKDYAKAAFADLDLVFSKVAIKPGKPVWFGRAGGKLVLGLPGNPTSALVTARLLLAPLIQGLSGGDPHAALRWRRAPLKKPLPRIGDRETFERGRWRDGGVEPLPGQDSGAQAALAEAALLIRRAAGAPAIDAGTEVDILSF